LIHGDLVRLFNTVPHAEIVSVLGYNHIRVRNPADVLAVIEKGLLLLLFDVIKM
jgi:hypothetical protein